MTETTPNMAEHDILLTLPLGRAINGPWLEKQAIQIEQALENRCPELLGPSVTANLAESSWELDLTILATGMADAYDKLGQVFRVVEEVAGVEFVNEGQDEVRSSAHAAPEPTDHSGTLTPA